MFLSRLRITTTSTFVAIALVEASSFAQPVAPPFSPPLPPSVAPPLSPPVAPPLPPSLARPVAPPLPSSGDQLPPLGPLPPGLVPPRVVPAPAPPSARPWSETPPVFEFPKSSWELGLGVSGRVTSVSEPRPTFVGSALFGDATFSVTRFLSPVVDDDAPLGLQPFLQRTSTLTGTFDFGGSSASVTQTNSGALLVKQFDLHGGPSVAANLYVVPEFALTMGFSYFYDAESTGNRFGNQQVTETAHEHQVSPSVGVAVRFDNTRIDLGYTFVGDTVVNPTTESDGQLWGTIAANLETVIAEAVDINVGAQVFDAGAGGSASVDFYPSKEFDVAVGGFGNAGRKLYRTGVTKHNDYGLNVSAGYWITPRVRLLASYQLSGTTILGGEDDTTSQLNNALLASLRLRLP